MRVPDLQRLGQVGEQSAEAVLHLEVAFAEFALLARLDFAAQILREDLHAITDSEGGHAEIKYGGIGQRGVLAINAGRTAGQNNPFGIQRGEIFGADIVTDYDGIHIALANPARDYLRVLGTKIENDDLFGHGSAVR